MTEYIAKINHETGIIEGFYVEEIHGKEFCDNLLQNGSILISEELWQELLTYGEAKLNIEKLQSTPTTLMAMKENNCLGMDYIDYFLKHEIPQDDQVAQPTQVELLEEKVSKMESQLEIITSQLSQLLLQQNK